MKTCRNQPKINSIDKIEDAIAAILRPYGIRRDELAQSKLALFGDDKAQLIELLERKLALQNARYCEQGGSLENVTFIASRR